MKIRIRSYRERIETYVPYQFSIAYLVLAAVLIALSFTKGSREPAAEI